MKFKEVFVVWSKKEREKIEQLKLENPTWTLEKAIEEVENEPYNPLDIDDSFHYPLPEGMSKSELFLLSRRFNEIFDAFSFFWKDPEGAREIIRQERIMSDDMTKEERDRVVGLMKKRNWSYKQAVEWVIGYERAKPSIKEIATDIGNFVEEKNQGYGNSFDKTENFLLSLYPNGIKPDQFTDAICSMRIFDKLSKLSSGNGDKFDENIYEDLMGVVLRMSLNNLGGHE